MRLYDFQFRHLPWAVAQFQGDQYSEILGFKDDFIKLNEEHFKDSNIVFAVDGMSWDEMQVTAPIATDDFLFFLYSFPKQTEMTLCDYVGFWHDRKARTVRYYTYEVSMPGTWVLGSQDAEQHYNYGTFDDGSERAFLRCVLNMELPRVDTEAILDAIYQTTDDSKAIRDILRELDTKDIDAIWRKYGDRLDTADASPLLGGQEVEALGVLYCKYAQYLFSKEYLQKSLEYATKAIDLINAHKSLTEGYYELAMSNLLELRYYIALRQDKYKDALKDIKAARAICPDKDGLREAENLAVKGIIVRYCNIAFVGIAIVWLLMLAEQYITHTHIIPSVVWTIGWVVWVVLLIVVFGGGYAIGKLRK